MVIGIILAVVASLVVWGVVSAREREFWVRCPVCGHETSHDKQTARKAILGWKPDSLVGAISNVRCHEIVRSNYRRVGGVLHYDESEAGCGEDLSDVYAAHPFVRELFAERARMRAQRATDKAYLDAELEAVRIDEGESPLRKEEVKS